MKCYPSVAVRHLFENEAMSEGTRKRSGAIKKVSTSNFGIGALGGSVISDFVR